MSATHRANCRACHRHKRDCGPISWGGYCGICGPLLAELNMDNLHDGNGPYYEHWVRRSLLAMRKRLLATEGAHA